MRIDRHRTTDSFLSFAVTKSYQDFALDCEAAFDAGITAVFGPSGSGKTTLLDSIAGMITPDHGEINVCGEPVYSSQDRIDVPLEKRGFGYVFQHGALFPHMTVRQNVLYGYRLTSGNDRRLDPDDVADLLAISHLMDRSVTNLSGGERQRVALARALSASPRLLLLDEPMASLDAAHRASILTYLRQVSEQLAAPMILVSHSLSEVMALAPNMLALQAGRAVAYGPTAEVMAHPDVAGIADFSTLENILDADVVSSDPSQGTSRLRVGETVLTGPPIQAAPGDRVSVSVRAGDIILSLGVPPLMSARNAVPTVIRDLREVGGRVLVYLDIADRMVAEVTPGSATELGLKVGLDIHVVIKSNSILVFTRTDQPLPI